MSRIRTSKSRALAIRTALSVFVVLAGLIAATRHVAWAVYPSPCIARRYAVATDHLQASRAGAEVLRAGGNAVDAAIAAALALGVVNPSSSGFGGGGFATVCSARGACTFIDFRETAPAGLTVEQIQHAADPAHASTIGGLAVGVPGEPRGFVEMSRRFGRLPLARVVGPAATLARSGFTVSDYLASAIVLQHAVLEHDPLLSAEFLPAGHDALPGAHVRRPLLARTLERYGRDGERFIDGPLATAVADAVHNAGGVLSADDVRAYRPMERQPLTRPFRGLMVVTAPPPSAGGVILLETLAWIDTVSPAFLMHGSSAYDHVLASAWRGAFDDRARFIGDPGGQANVAESLLAPARMAQRIAAFDPAHVRPVIAVEPARDHGTSHVCVADADGMMVALTTTVNLQFGARFTVPEMDIVLNDQIDDFSLGTPGNNFGMSPSQADALVPGTPSGILDDADHSIAGRPSGRVRWRVRWIAHSHGDVASASQPDGPRNGSRSGGIGPAGARPGLPRSVTRRHRRARRRAGRTASAGLRRRRTRRTARRGTSDLASRQSRCARDPGCQRSAEARRARRGVAPNRLRQRGSDWTALAGYGNPEIGAVLVIS